jgi:large subunit ribosomal protein L35
VRDGCAQQEGRCKTPSEAERVHWKFRRKAPDTRQGIKREVEASMPKMKTKKGAAKRFRVRASGSVKRGQAFKRHILTKKTTKSKRQLRGTVEVHARDLSAVKSMLPYA